MTRILIVDDEPDILATLSDILLSGGHQVTPAKDGTEAIAVLKTNQVDLILLDIMMPGLKTHEILRILSDDPKTKNVPVVLVSAMRLTPKQLSDLASTGRVVGYIAKPFDIDAILSEASRRR